MTPFYAQCYDHFRSDMLKYPFPKERKQYKADQQQLAYQWTNKIYELPVNKMIFCQCLFFQGENDEYFCVHQTSTSHQQSPGG